MPFLYCCVRVRFRENVFTESLLRNGCLLIAYCIATAVVSLFVSRILSSNGSIRHNIYIYTYDVFINYSRGFRGI
jgi:hypothetical protein